jgi:hypothetical protein
MYAPSLMLRATMPAIAASGIVQKPKWSVGQLNAK